MGGHLSGGYLDICVSEPTRFNEIKVCQYALCVSEQFGLIPTRNVT